MWDFNIDSHTRTKRDRHRQTIGESIPTIQKCCVNPSRTNTNQERKGKRRNICVIKTVIHGIFKST